MFITFIERTWRLVLVLTVVLGATGCVAPAASGGAFKDAGYRQAVYGYGIAYRNAGGKQLLGPDWQLENYHQDGGNLVEKLGKDYVATRAEDLNNDGTVDVRERREEAVFDLRFVSKSNGGVIWVKAHPVLPELAERSLDVVIDGYANSLTGTGRYAEGDLFSIEQAKERNFTTFMVSRHLTQVGGHAGLEGSIELAEVDKLRTDPTYRAGKLRLVLIRLRCFSPATCRKEPLPTRSDADRWPLVDCRGEPCRARSGLLVVGYYNTPEYYEAGLNELDELLKRFSFIDAEPLPTPAPKPIPAVESSGSSHTAPEPAGAAVEPRLDSTAQ